MGAAVQGPLNPAQMGSVNLNMIRAVAVELYPPGHPAPRLARGFPGTVQASQAAPYLEALARTIYANRPRP